MAAIDYFRTVLDDLESIHSKCPRKVSHLWPLKVELGLLRTFYLCGRKFGKGVRCESVLLSIEDAVLKNAAGLRSLCLGLAYDELPRSWDDSFFVVYEFQRSIYSLPAEINELYLIFSDVSLQTTSSSSPQQDELVDIINSLLENLRDLMQCGSFGDPFDALEENLRFLKNFIHFATLRGLEQGRLEDLLTHIEGLVINSSRLIYMSRFVDYHDYSKLFVLLQKFKPVEPHICQIYVHVFQASKLSPSSDIPTPARERSVSRDLVHSLLDILWERMNCGASYMVSSKDQVQTLYEGLGFLRTILREQQDQFDELYEKIRDTVGVVICEAGIVISSLFVKETEEGLVDMKENEEGLFKELDLMCLDVMEKIKLIKAEAGEKYPVTSVFSFPRTNMLGIIDAVLEKMKSVSPYVADSIALVKDKFQTLHEHLVILRSFLGDFMVQCDHDENLQALLSHVARIAYETEFIFDSFVVGDARHSLIMRLNTITEEIKLIKTEALETFHGDRQVIKVQKLAKNSSSEMPSARNIPVFNELVVGFEDEAQKIINRLVRGTKQLDIVSIVGMPGVNKTTLAKRIYNDPSIPLYFHVRAWCSISQVYNKKSLLLDILHGINLDDERLEKNEDDLAKKHLENNEDDLAVSDSAEEHLEKHEDDLAAYDLVKKLIKFLEGEKDEDDVAKKHLEKNEDELAKKHLEKNEDDLANVLRKSLKGKKYLIVLDDVWECGVWNDLGSSFPEDANGSRSLFTSRLHDVALQIKPDSEPHALGLLTKNQSWELLRKKIGYIEGSSPALDPLGMQIAQNCRGLPLTIVTVAGILSTTEQDAWKEVAETLHRSTLSITEQCKNTLELSYCHLPYYLRPCFLYFATFAEDQVIPIQRLLQLWIAEGLVEKTEEKCLEQVAEEYLMDFIQRSLVMVVRRGSMGKVKACTVHDVLHEFCVAKSKEEHFLQWVRGYDELRAFNELGMLHRLCVYSTREHFGKSRLFCPRVRSLRFLVADRNWHGQEDECNFLYIFGLFKLLRVLDLEAISLGNSFPIEIVLLVHVRYLAIQGRMSAIPSSIDNLSNLETLRLKGDHCAVSLPNTLWNMKKLRHLCITGVFARWELPKENLQDTSNLEHLYTLSTLSISFGEGTEKLMRKFPNIRRLKCELSTEEECTGGRKILALDFMTELESLTIFLDRRAFLLGEQDVLSDLQFQFPSNLKKLVLSKLCLQWSKISAIAELQNLEVLKLLENAFIGEVWEIEEGQFPKLRFLKLLHLDLVRWTGSDDNFPCLEKLVLEKCPHLNEVPSSLGYLSTLEMIEVSGCKAAANSIKQVRKELEERGNENLRCLFHEMEESYMLEEEEEEEEEEKEEEEEEEDMGNENLRCLFPEVEESFYSAEEEEEEDMGNENLSCLFPEVEESFYTAEEEAEEEEEEGEELKKGLSSSEEEEG